ncbi:hypothetical protein GCM10009819_00310 [Agromyces tropicus]|uniref:Uncharacterized protein n=1 Tax=Agromyces tropicus TaxID=555371 RepID=A0ABN2TU64_9MICO
MSNRRSRRVHRMRRDRHVHVAPDHGEDERFTPIGRFLTVQGLEQARLEVEARAEADGRANEEDDHA